MRVDTTHVRKECESDRTNFLAKEIQSTLFLPSQKNVLYNSLVEHGRFSQETHVTSMTRELKRSHDPMFVHETTTPTTNQSVWQSETTNCLDEAQQLAWPFRYSSSL